MNASDDLYREIILDHYRNTANKKRLEPVDYHEQGVNPSCGDDIELFINTEGGRITAVTYDGIGCSICLASADMLCESLKGMTIEAAGKLLARFKAMLTEGGEAEFPDEAADLEALQGVSNYPVRIKCALLSWNTLDQILARAKADAEPDE
jgi:nitrogen fixation protein NifU and related proteins